MHVVVHGLNHRTASLDVRERAALLPDEAADAMEELIRRGAAAESVVLSTCNRTEFYAVTDDPAGLVVVQRELLRERKRVDPEPGHVAYVHERRDGVKHLFRVAGGIDSMVLGENGIVAQVKDAFEYAQAAGTVGPMFGKLFPAALRVAKRSRTETDIAHGVVSLPKAGLTLARKIFGSLEKRRAVVVGAGATGRRLAERLREENVARIVIANRTLAHAEELAADVGGVAIPLEDLPEALADADLVMTAVHTATPLLDRALMNQAMASRNVGRPMLVVDLGVPRNVDPRCGSREGVFLYAVDDLQDLVERNLGRRRKEIPAVERIVTEETERFLEWMVALDAAPIVVAMREHADQVRREALDKFGKSMSDGEREQLEKFSRALVNKLLHDPTVSVRGCDSKTPLGRTRLDWTRRLFGLDRDGDGSGGGDPTGNGS
jgi:glutamyl-tRNA reductase